MQTQSCISVVEDDDAVRTALLRLVSTTGHQTYGFSTATEFLESDLFCKPGCLLLDFSLPDISGLDLLQELNVRKATVPVIFMSGYGDVPITVRAMKLGAIDFLTKPVRETVLFATIDNALALGEQRRGVQVRGDEVRGRIATLTPREREVLDGVLLGRLNKQIARALGISEKTVKVHRGRVMTKMGVRHVAQLAQLAAEIEYHVVDARASNPPRILSVPAWRRRVRDEVEVSQPA
jgi:FixJ family two-component response regulator